MVASPRFEVVEEPDPPQAGEPKTTAATQMLFIALKALSQRALIAIDNLFCLLTVGGVFWLWASIPDPNPNQIVALTIFATFVLAANWLVRRK